jgi:murein DD-endopeptidase MepM/ murein hydrolase activator NlpD
MLKTALRFLLILLLGSALAALANPACPPAYGQSAKKKMERNRQQRDKLYVRIKQLNDKKDSLLDGIEMVDGRIDNKSDEISSIQSQLTQASERFETLTSEKQELESRLRLRKQNLSLRARAIYMQGDVSLVDVLFQAASFNDLVDRLFFVQAVLDQDRTMVEDTQLTQVDLRGKISSIESQIQAIESIKQKLQSELTLLQDLKGEKQLDMEAIDKDKSLYMRQIKELEGENNRIRDQLRNLSTSASGYKGKPWTSSFKKPVSGPITSGFGYRKHPIFGVTKMHTGVDISAPEGTTIKAAGKGKVVFAGTGKGYGKYVIIDHGNGRSTLYGHMSRISCTAGDEVNVGDKIGEVGSTGYSTGNHCHFEVRINGDPVDPMTATE